MNMNEKVRKELTHAAENLEMDFSAIEEKWNELCSDNNMVDENDSNIALSLFRQWHSGMRRVASSGEAPKQKTGGDNHTVFGYVVASEELRDFEEYNRDKLRVEIIRDANAAFNAGKFARVTQLADGTYEVSQIMNNETITRPLNNTELPESTMEIDGNLIVPIDNQQENPWGVNKKYGHPKPLNNFQRAVHFIGSLNGGTIQYWRIGLKNEVAKNWNVEEQRAVYIDVYANSEHLDAGNLYNPNLESVIYNDELETPQPANNDLQTLIGENMRGFVSPLVQLEHYHVNNKSRPTKERMVVTDGNVTNMYMNPNTNGNRTLYISDLNADYDYDGDGYSSTPCWVPEHINLDFGIGSHVLIIGRSNQSMNQDTGQMRQCSINVFGVIVLNRRGSPNQTTDSGEQYSGWF